MKFDKKDAVLTIGGIVASVGVAYVVYRLQQQSAAQAQAVSDNNSAEIESELANQQAQIASLPSIDVPALNSLPSGTDAANQYQSSAYDQSLEQIISSYLAGDSSSVTNSSSPSGNANPSSPIIAQLPVNTFVAPQNPVVQTQSSGGQAVQQPSQASGFSSQSQGHSFSA